MTTEEEKELKTAKETKIAPKAHPKTVRSGAKAFNGLEDGVKFTSEKAREAQKKSTLAQAAKRAMYEWAQKTILKHMGDEMDIGAKEMLDIGKFLGLSLDKQKMDVTSDGKPLPTINYNFAKKE